MPKIFSKNVLPYGSPEYGAHSGEIVELLGLAEQLGKLRSSFRNEIMDQDGIVCDREREDDHASVSRSFFGLAKNLNRVASKENPKILERKNNLRALLEGVLATRLSIMEYASQNPPPEKSPLKAYQMMIADIEDYCFRNNLPSLLPNMFSPASLFSRLRDEPAYVLKTDKPHVRELFEQLAALFAWQDNHLHVVVTTVYRQGQCADAVRLIEEAAQARGTTGGIMDLFHANPLLAETYVCSLFDLRRYNDVIRWCRDLGEDIVAQYNPLAEKYVRSLIEMFVTDDAAAFIVAHHGVMSKNWNRHLKKSFTQACVAVAWMYHGRGETERAQIFISQYVPPDFLEDSDVKFLLETLNTQE